MFRFTIGTVINPSTSQQAATSSTPFLPSRPQSRIPPARSQNSLVDTHHNRRPPIVLPHQVDHNYGEPGPSSLRTRGMISRHQRNADELDALDSLHNQQEQQPTSSSRARMIRTGPNPGEGSSSGLRIMQRRTKNRGNFSEESQEICENDLDNSKKLSASDASSDNSENNSSSDNDDSDDDTPLNMMVTSSGRRRPPKTRSGGNSKKRYYSEEEQVKFIFSKYIQLI